MLAIVVTLGGYFAGLQWLISPPDPWQTNAKIPAGTQQFTARKRPPVVKPAEAANPESTASAQPDTRSASVETTAPVESGQNETARPIEQNIAQETLPAKAAQQTGLTHPAAERAHIVRREAPSMKTRPASRKRLASNPGRKLELMVLRTYERSDGKRFTRLLPMSNARNAMAFQPDD